MLTGSQSESGWRLCWQHEVRQEVVQGLGPMKERGCSARAWGATEEGFAVRNDTAQTCSLGTVVAVWRGLKRENVSVSLLN